MPEYRADEIDVEALRHYGILRRSGRYPWGSGGDPSARARDFTGMVEDLVAQGMSKTEIAKGFGMTTTQLRDATTIARNTQRRDNQIKAEKLRAKGWGASAIAKEMNLNESSVRSLLDKSAQDRARVLENTAEMLRAEVENGGWIDVGIGSEYYVPGGGISKERLRAAVAILKDEGYEVHPIQIDQSGQRTKTTTKVLCPPGTEYKDVVVAKDQIRSLTKTSDDGGRTWTGDLPPMSIDSKRVQVLYKEDGGELADGVMYIRPGVKDISIGAAKYAQVRVDVDGTHYLKGMAVYKKDLPPGVDIQFNTNKSKTDPKIVKGGKLAALKEQTGDPENPFGAVIKRQLTETGPDGKERVTSAMNILQEEGSWDQWSRTLSTQVLSKQSPKLAEQQLAKTYDKKRKEYEEIAALTNPTVREKLLETFSNSADSDAVHLSAAGLPRSSYHVILPFKSLKDNEVYAPNFNHGERVALIRYPHGGTFEIPELTVNNNAPEPKAQIGRAKDAVGINSRVAERLSGADFDGDFVMVIPNNDSKIKSTSPLKQLEKFDRDQYKLPDDAPRMSPKTKQKQMGDVSNLITDMTIQKAPMSEIARAVKHSMVVIDAEKHHLDYKRSAVQNGIPALKEKYQGRHPNGQLKGAATLISRASSTQYVEKRRLRRASEGGAIDPATGELIYVPTGEKRRNVKTLKDGTVRVKETPVMQESTKLAEAKDAHSLVSKDGGTVVEKVYADHSNRLKALANEARKEMVTNTTPIATSPSAKRVYQAEIKQLKADLHIAKMNSPRERSAQVIAGAIVAQKKAAQPDMDSATYKKVQAQALREARYRAGAKKVQVPITDRQWEAIQAGAISKSMLKDILDNADLDRVKELATPRPTLSLDRAAASRARALEQQGVPQADIARILGIGLTTLKKGLDGG